MNRTFLSILALLLALAALAATAVSLYRNQPLELSASPIRVRIERGTGLSAIGTILEKSGLGQPGWQFELAARLRGDGHRIKAGVYEFKAPITRQALIDKMVRGDVLLSEVTVIEGWTFRQMRAVLARHPDLTQDAAALDEPALLARIGATETRAEGLFLPDTYRFSPGSSDLEVYRQAYRQLRRALDDAWAARSAGVPLRTPYQALVLASIIEKETGRDADRDRVAAVFVNRLRKGMMLQSDPTTIYGLGEAFDGNLRRADLRADTPYNTYTRAGLPPTPIALPGKASLAAALNPANSPALYFVARGDGSSEFSDDLVAHQRAVDRYQKRRTP
ncbi:MAG: endolytic transglycosylase MltG [Burkholderiaceae bacterium]|nr:endolytic transglycosylase MltG [Burkholderiaceae bacterium]MBP6813611.1 endolytic transglycosylase MltG [Burkholderiaceae bacterium]